MANAIRPAEEPVPTTAEELGKFIERTEAGGKTTLPVLRKLLNDPHYIEQFGGNLARTAEFAFISALTGKHICVQEALKRKMKQMREELLGPNPTPVERLLAERVVACWLQVQDADYRFGSMKEPTFKQSEFAQRRMDRANARYLAAVKTLALVRKLAVPALQVNIARRQLNVASAALPSTSN